MKILFIVDSYGQSRKTFSPFTPMLCLSASFVKMAYPALCNAFKKPGFSIWWSKWGLATDS